MYTFDISHLLNLSLWGSETLVIGSSSMADVGGWTTIPPDFVLQRNLKTYLVQQDLNMVLNNVITSVLLLP